MYSKSTSSNWVLIGQTEQIKNNLNPDFTTAISISYNFEKNQPLKFEVIDEDGAGSGTGDLIGSVEVALAKIMGSKA